MSRGHDYTEFAKDQKARYQAIDARCWMDGQKIDYTAPAGAPDAFDLDHVKSYKHHPELLLDPGNCRPSHARCNRSRQTSSAHPPLGPTSEQW